MKVRRPFLLALLLPLLLELLVVFTARPLAAAEELSCCEPEAAEMFKGLFGAEAQQAEEEEEKLLSALAGNHNQVAACPASYGRRGFFSTAATADPLAFGWRMPLRI